MTTYQGWPILGDPPYDDQVLVGSGCHCIGCGRVLGVICVVIPEQDPQLPEPIFEHTEGDCPVCRERERVMRSLDRIRAAGHAWPRAPEDHSSGDSDLL